MLFKDIAVLCLIGMAVAQPIDSPSTAAVQIVRDERENFEDGGYRFAFETSDGQKREEMGTLIRNDGDTPYMMVVGSFSYIGPDGNTYGYNYVADKNGFRPDILPDLGSVGLMIPELPPAAFPAKAINSLLG